MAKKQASAAVTEQALPGLEDEPLPEGLEKAIAKYYAVDRLTKQASADGKKNVDAAFATVKTKMHENNIKEVRLRIDGTWKRFRLLNQEKGKFEKAVQPKDQKPVAITR